MIRLHLLVFIFSLLGVSLPAEEEEQAAQLNLQLRDRGQRLHQSREYGPAEAPKHFFLLKHVFPAGATENTVGSVQTPSMQSSDNKFRLYGTLGQTTTGRSEDTANFRVTTGFFASSRKSSFRVRSVRERRRPMVMPRR